MKKTHQLGQFGRRVKQGAGGGGPSDPFFSFVVSLCHCDGADLSPAMSDEKGHSWTLSSLALDTGLFKFGSASLEAAGSGHFAEATSASFAAGSGDWTIEFEHNVTSVSGFRGIFDMRPTGVGTGLYPTIYQNGSNLIFFTNGADRITATGVLSTGTWRHIAVSKVSGVTRMFVEGTQVGSNYTDSNTYIGNRVRLMNFGDSTSGPLLGHLDEFRYTVGYGRYSANFTRPSAAHPNF